MYRNLTTTLDRNWMETIMLDKHNIIILCQFHDTKHLAASSFLMYNTRLIQQQNIGSVKI